MQRRRQVLISTGHYLPSVLSVDLPAPPKAVAWRVFQQVSFEVFVKWKLWNMWNQMSHHVPCPIMSHSKFMTQSRSIQFSLRHVMQCVRTACFPKSFALALVPKDVPPNAGGQMHLLAPTPRTADDFLPRTYRMNQSTCCDVHKLGAFMIFMGYPMVSNGIQKNHQDFCEIKWRSYLCGHCKCIDSYISYWVFADGLGAMGTKMTRTIIFDCLKIGCPWLFLLRKYHSCNIFTLQPNAIFPPLNI